MILKLHLETTHDGNKAVFECKSVPMTSKAEDYVLFREQEVRARSYPNIPSFLILSLYQKAGRGGDESYCIWREWLHFLPALLLFKLDTYLL